MQLFADIVLLNKIDLVTPEELAAVEGRIRSLLNGQVMQDANTSDMIFSVAETIALLADVLTLEPGDVIVMGTPAGVGQARNPPVWMKAGDTIVIDIEKVGALSNPIVAEAALPICSMKPAFRWARPRMFLPSSTLSLRCASGRALQPTPVRGHGQRS